MKHLFEFKQPDDNEYIFVIASSCSEAADIATEYTGSYYDVSFLIDDEVRVCDNEENRITERIVI